MRKPLRICILAIAFLIAGCTTEDVAMRDIALMSSDAVVGFRQAGVAPPAHIPSKDLWAVQPFEEKARWLADHKQLEPGRWGKRLSILIERKLRGRGIRATAHDHQLTPQEIGTLVEKAGLKYVVSGRLESLRLGDSVTLEFKYVLRKKISGKLPVTHVQRLSVSAPGKAPLQDSDLSHLLDLAADRIAKQLTVELSGDLFAERG